MKKHNRHPEDGLVVVLHKAGVKLGTANDNKLKKEDALFFFVAYIEPLGNLKGTKTAAHFEFYSNERGDHGWVFGSYAKKGELDFVYGGYGFDFLHIYPADWADKYPAHLRAVPVRIFRKPKNKLNSLAVEAV